MMTTDWVGARKLNYHIELSSYHIRTRGMNTRPHPPYLTGYPFRWAAGAVRLACVGPSLRFLYLFFSNSTFVRSLFCS